MLVAIGTVVAGGAVGDVSGDFSLIDLLFEAHIVVRLVLLMLVIASLWSWGRDHREMVHPWRAQKVRATL